MKKIKKISEIFGRRQGIKDMLKISVEDFSK